MRIKFRVRAGTVDDFKEGEHPRGPDGKFTSGAAGGKDIQSGITFPKQGSLTNKVWHMAHEYQKKHGVQPSPKQLQDWAKGHGLELNKNTLGVSLYNYKKWSENAEQPAKEQKSEKPKIAKPKVAEPEKPKEIVYPKTNEGFAQLAETNGFTKEGDFNGMPYYQKGSVKVSFSEEHGTWQMKQNGQVVAKGDDMNKLNGAMMNYAGSLFNAPPKSQQPVYTPPDKHDTKSAPVYASVKAAGNFKFTKYGIPDASGFPESIKAAIQSYTGSGYSAINSAMRFESDFDKLDVGVMRKILNIQKAFHIVPPTTEDCTVGRKVGLEALKTMAKSAGLNHLSELQEGSIIQDDAVVSTSHAGHVWSGDVKFDIKVPKGSKAINVEDISHHSSEQETLLPPGSKFKINKVQKNHKGHEFYLEVELLP